MNILLAIIGAIGGATAGYLLPSSKVGSHFGSEQKKLEETKQEAEQLLKEAVEKVSTRAERFKDEETSLKENLDQMEKVIVQKEDILKRRGDRNKTYEGRVSSIKKELEALNKQERDLAQNSIDQLTRASKMTREKALEYAQNELAELVTEGSEQRAKAELEEYEEDIMRHATAVLQLVIQRLGVPSSVDRNNTTVKVNEDKFKGMLIGKDAVNIKYLEELLPVSIIFNLSDPKSLHVGGVNLLRRNIAKRAINKMQKAVKRRKKVTHELIKQTVETSEAEIMEECDKKGRWAYKQMGLNWKDAPAELVNYVGRMYFRTSYGQNIIHHSLEMAFAARLISELTGMDEDVAMLAAFYHDIGKAIDHDIGGSHDDISKEILEKYGFDPRIVHAAYAHHDKVPCESPADFIVKAVDAISGGRPGARMESVTNYFERMKELEDAAKSFKGVGKVFTMSAGREVRVIVDKDQIKDPNMQGLGDKIAGKISEEISFPGIIKVNLIRQTKPVDYARDKTKRH